MPQAGDGVRGCFEVLADQARGKCGVATEQRLHQCAMLVIDRAHALWRRCGMKQAYAPVTLGESGPRRGRGALRLRAAAGLDR